MTLDASYILPIRNQAREDVTDLTAYLRRLQGEVELIVVDGSPPDVFAYHEAAWAGITHIAPSPALRFANGKVGGVLTGVAIASHERLVIADDDVRYDLDTLSRVVDLLDDAEVVRPQNYFEPLPWHARWDSARSLLNRISGGDWPGTLAVRRSVLEATHGYNGDCMFENFELVRTVRAAGGREVVASGVFVPRRPPTTSYFLAQRVRQAYDEFARPWRMFAELALLPLSFVLLVKRPAMLVGLTGLSIAAAEAGRRRSGATHVFPASTSLFAPLWLLERGVCSWLAVGSRLRYGGVRYRDHVVSQAATPPKKLQRDVARRLSGRAA